jgi:hypothetical protein
MLQKINKTLANATNLVLNGVDLVTVKELMGHADISMTMRYAHPSPESKRRSVDGLLNCEKTIRYLLDGQPTNDEVGA